ncbi:lantibiotic dehydratase [Psychroserpens algicola]|uniref:Lantibiotic dehydratase family protein n=1 Tax=Psychroserpens algicola TaxID=1719034 RepID=A0ABT0HC27_9FLAO|nr:lantibiotic dehydratase family protein [Psychroserpens algicola]
MKKQKNPYQIFNNYILRTPLLSYQFYKKLHQNDPITNADFKAVFEIPVVNEALYLASPELHNQLEKWYNDDLDDAFKTRRLQDSFLKYTSRLTARCTPFGLFAACSVGEFSHETDIEMNTIDHFSRVTRFDMTFLSALSKLLSNDPKIKQQLIFYPNNSLYKIGSQYRYVEYKTDGKHREYSLEGITHSEAIEAVLKYAVSGKSIIELSKSLVSKDITIEEASGFIDQLIELQILVSNLDTPVTGKGALEHTIEILKPMVGVNHVLKKLYHLNSSLNTIDTNTDYSVQLYRNLTQDIEDFNLSFDSKYLFQTDLFSNAKTNTLEFKLKKELKEAMGVLNKISRSYNNQNLSRFKSAFLKRYENNEVPLTLALDVESGLGYNTERGDSNTLIDDLFLPKQKPQFQNIEWSKFDDLLLQRINESISIGSKSIQLTDEDLKHLPEQWDDLPSTMSSIIELINDNSDTKIVINAISGSSAASLLARFSNGSPEIAACIDKIISVEERIETGSIIAEIVHLPQDRTGNILQRLPFRKYEIPYLGNSTLPQKQQISINDLMVSVQPDGIYLRSKTHNKYVIPRLTNAHNFSVDALPIYHFLCDLQSQNQRASIYFSWNPIFQKYAFLPRVEYKNIILSKARWLIKIEDISRLTNDIAGIKHQDVNQWQQNMNLPKYVELVEGDNTLLIDLENLRAVEMLLQTIKKKKTFVLQEFLFTGNGIVKQNEEPLCNEFVISFYNESTLKQTTNE